MECMNWAEITKRSCLFFLVDGLYLRRIRCEFVRDDSVSDESEAYLVSSAFIPKVSMMIVIAYRISSPDVAVEFLIVSQLTEEVRQRHLLSWQRHFLKTYVKNDTEPIYLVWHAYNMVWTETSLVSSITILKTQMVQNYNRKSKMVSCSFICWVRDGSKGSLWTDCIVSFAPNKTELLMGINHIMTYCNGLTATARQLLSYMCVCMYMAYMIYVTF